MKGYIISLNWATANSNGWIATWSNWFGFNRKLLSRKKRKKGRKKQENNRAYLKKKKKKKRWVKIARRDTNRLWLQQSVPVVMAGGGYNVRWQVFNRRIRPNINGQIGLSLIRDSKSRLLKWKQRRRSEFKHRGRITFITNKILLKIWQQIFHNSWKKKPKKNTTKTKTKKKRLEIIREISLTISMEKKPKQKTRANIWILYEYACSV